MENHSVTNEQEVNCLKRSTSKDLNAEEHLVSKSDSLASGRQQSKRSKLLRFNRTDAILIIALIVIACCTFTSFLEANSFEKTHPSDFLAPIFLACIALAAAIGAITGRKRIDMGASAILISILALGYLVHMNVAEVVTPGINKFKEHESLSQLLTPNPPKVAAAWFKIPVAIGITFFASAIATRLVFRNTKGVEFVSSGLKWMAENRTKCLIGLAILLFTLHTIRNVFFAEGSITARPLQERVPQSANSNPAIVGLELNKILILGLAAVVLATLMNIVTAIATSRWKYWVRFLILSFFGALASGFCVVQYSAGNVAPMHVDFFLPSAAIVSASFFLGISVLSKPNIDESGIPKPSIWAWLILMPTLGFVGFVGYTYDPIWLVQPQHMIRKFAINKLDHLEIAKQSRKYLRDSHGSISLRNTGFANPLWWIKIRDESDKNVLATIPNPALFKKIGSSGQQLVAIDGIQPFVDTSSLINPAQPKSKRPPIALTLNNGSLTSKQLGELSEACSWIGFLNVELPTFRDPNFLLASPIMLLGELDHSIASFLDSHITQLGPAIFVQKKIDLGEWRAIIRASQHTPITVSRLPPNADLELGGQSLANITLYPLSNDETAIEEFMNLALNSEIGLPNVAWSDKQKWDLAFVSKSQLSIFDFEPLKKLSDANFLQKAREFNWIIRDPEPAESTNSNSNNKPLEIWLPETTYIKNHLAVLDQLKTLRLDVRGIANILDLDSTLNNYNELDGLYELESLHMPAGIQLDDLNFLKTSPKLRLLQIQNQNRQQQPPSGFEQCKNLEVLIMFDGPDAKSVAELQQLKKLKSITIIDFARAFTNDEQRIGFQKQFPNAKVEFVLEQDYIPVTSKAFKSFKQQLRAKVEKQIEKRSMSDSE